METVRKTCVRLPLWRERQATRESGGRCRHHRAKWWGRRYAVELGVEVTHASVDLQIRLCEGELDLRAVNRGHSSVEEERHYAEPISHLNIVVPGGKHRGVQPQVIGRIRLD